MSEMNERILEFIARIPFVIQPGWDEKYAPRLAGFPVNLVFTRVCVPDKKNESPQISASCCYQFNFETFHENSDKRQMTYRSRANEIFHVEVSLYKRSSEIEVTKFRGETFLWQASGASFNGAMLQTMMMGMEADEVEDTPSAPPHNPIFIR